MIALLSQARGRVIHFAAPPVAYSASTSVKVYEGTEIYGDGATTLFRQTSNMEPLFDCMGEPGVTIRDLKGVYLGGTANATSNRRGGSAMATCALVWTNDDNGTFTDLTSEDFGVCVRVDNYDGVGRDARCSGLTVADITAVRPNFGILVSGCSDSTFNNITSTDIQQDLPGVPPHSVYFTSEGHEAAYMANNTITNVSADGCPDAAFSLKALLNSTVTGMTADDCTALFTARFGEGVTFSTGSGTTLTGDTATGVVYTEFCTDITITGITVRLVADPEGDDTTPGRGAVIIGDQVTVNGFDIEFPQDNNAAAACLWFGAAGYDTSDYTITNVTAVNTGDSAGYAAQIRNVPSGFSLTASTVTGFPSDHFDEGTTAGVVWSP